MKHPAAADPARDLIEQARRAWTAGDLAALATVPIPPELPGPSRRALTLLAAAAAWAEPTPDLGRARELAGQALALGTDPALLARAWLGVIERDLADAGSAQAQARRDRAQQAWLEVAARAEPGASVAPATRLSSARAEAARLRAEAERLRAERDRLQRDAAQQPAAEDRAQALNQRLEEALAAQAAAVAEVRRYREEVLRQRGLIESLRSAVKEHGPSLHTDGMDRALIKRILGERLTYLSPARMLSIARTCHVIEQRRVPGCFIEAGCALGGSAILIGTLKDPQRPLRVHDVFGMIPPPSAEDTPEVHERYRTIVEGRSKGIGNDRYYGYEDDLQQIVRRNFESFGLDLAARRIELVAGLVQDTLQGEDPVAFAHIDLDWYEPVTVCLERLWPRLSTGGTIIVDDYHDWGGCRRAVDRFLAQVGPGCMSDDSASSMKLTKVRS